MKRFSILALLALVLYAVVAWVGSGAAQSGASGTAAVVLMVNRPVPYAQASASGSSSAEANAEADANADGSYNRLRQLVETQGAKASASARAKTETKLEASVKRVDGEASKDEEQVANRLAAEFKTTADAMIAEQTNLDASWGELMLAHAIAANVKTAVTVPELIRMRADHIGWGTIAAGLGLNLGEVASAASAETRVAAGLAKADGRVAVIHGEGARAGVGAGVGAGAGLGAGQAKAGASVGLGVGIKSGH